MSDSARASINATIDDIARIQREMGPRAAIATQAEDREAFEIIRRIERKIKARRAAQQQAAE